jgi:energy-coupling factor transport system permease protein
MAENFELLRNITIGQYVPTASFVHRLDGRAKLASAFLLAVALSLANTVLTTWLLVVLMLGIAALSRLPISYVLRGLRPALPLILIIVVFQIVFRGRFVGGEIVFFEWWLIRISDESIRLIIVGIGRLIGFIFLTSLVTLTSNTTELTHGLEQLLRPLTAIRFPVHEFALAVTIGLRFVPTLAEELERVMKAQASRLGYFNAREWWRPDKAARARLPLIVPLFLSALRRGEELAQAMEARGYVGGQQRSRLVQFRSRPMDWGVMLAILLLVIGVWWLQ